MWVPGGALAGKISKPNGLQGKVNVVLSPEAGKHIKTDNPLFIDIDGQRVPFFVEECDQLSNDLAVVKFEYVENVEAARELAGCEVFLDHSQKQDLPGNPNTLTALLGYQAMDKDLGPLGTITDYMDHEMNPVFLIDYHGKELMVPAVSQFIERIDHPGKIVHLLLPEGLTTL